MPSAAAEADPMFMYADSGVPVFNRDSLTLTEDTAGHLGMSADEETAVNEALNVAWNEIRALEEQNVLTAYPTNLVPGAGRTWLQRPPDLHISARASSEAAREVQEALYHSISNVLGAERYAAFVPLAQWQLNMRFRAFGRATRDISLWIEGPKEEPTYWIYERSANASHSYFGPYRGIESLPVEYRHLYEAGD
jgi:hypothetical protein